jgi:hypothetical protein
MQNFTKLHNRLQPTYYVLINFFHELNKLKESNVSVGLEMHAVGKLALSVPLKTRYSQRVLSRISSSTRHAGI